MGENIPVIDISSFTSEKQDKNDAVVEAWRDAFSSLGFAIVVGHGVPEDLIKDLHSDLVQYFSQDKSEKMKDYLNQGYGKGGYVPQGDESVGKTMVYNSGIEGKDSYEESPPDIVETLEFFYGVDQDKGDYVPQYPKSLVNHLQEYWNEMGKLRKCIIELSSLALGLEKEYLNQYFSQPYQRFRLAFYPAQHEVRPKKGQLRYGSHTDYTGFAIVCQDDAPGGLEVLGSKGQWIPVQHIKGSLVVNSGDLLQRWTNDCWKSNIHRVVNPPEEQVRRHRLSFVFFLGPNKTSVIEPLKVCCSQDNPAKYPPISCEEHLQMKLNISNLK